MRGGKAQYIGLLPWSPLGGGVLTGKYSRDGRGPKGCRFGEKLDEENFWRQRFVNARNLRIAEAVSSTTTEIGVAPAAVALAWLLGRPMVNSIIIGPRSVRQLKENLAACDVKLTATQIKRLDEVSAPAVPYPAEFIAKTRRNMLERNAEW